MATRKGRQTPTTSVVQSFKKSRGAEAVELYNSTGRTAQRWQENILKNMLALTSTGLWRHTKYGYSSVPRLSRSRGTFCYSISKYSFP